VRVVAEKLEIFEGKIWDVFDGWIQFHPGQNRRPRESCPRARDGFVKMQIAERVNKIARRKIDNLRPPSVRRAALDPK